MNLSLYLLSVTAARLCSRNRQLSGEYLSFRASTIVQYMQQEGSNRQLRASPFYDGSASELFRSGKLTTFIEVSPVNSHHKWEQGTP